MFYPNNNHRYNFALMKKIALFVAALLIAVISFGQTVPVRAKTFQITYGSDSYSINLNGDSILIDASDFIWFADKFGSDTLLFGDGTYMTTADAYIKTTGDTITGNYRYWLNGANDIKVGATSTGQSFIGSSLYGYIGTTVYSSSPCIPGDLSSHLYPTKLYFTNTAYTTDLEQLRIVKGDCSDYDTIYSEAGLEIRTGDLKINTTTTTFTGRINNLMYTSDSTALIDDASVVLTNGIYGWGEVYVFNSGTIDEWAEFIISTDGTVYLKSNSTDVANTDTDNKLCIFDNGSGVTIRNRLGGVRTIKYIIHH